MTVVSLLTPYPCQPGLDTRANGEREGPTWRMPLSSRSPRSLTKTRSESETRIRSNGSAIWVAAMGSGTVAWCDVAESNEARVRERSRSRAGSHLVALLALITVESLSASSESNTLPPSRSLPPLELAALFASLFLVNLGLCLGRQVPRRRRLIGRKGTAVSPDLRQRMPLCGPPDSLFP